MDLRYTECADSQKRFVRLSETSIWNSVTEKTIVISKGYFFLLESKNDIHNRRIANNLQGTFIPRHHNKALRFSTPIPQTCRTGTS